ncbi:MAG: hypothetical protein K1X89_16225 [Myxococcaceae bacterium]|nr:hypothetical protein [Myxococcaceae bacterium]
MEETSSVLLSVLLPRLPFFAVMAVACVVAVVRWDKHPPISAMVLGACAVDVLLGVAGGLLPFFMRERGLPMSSVGLVSGGLSVVGAASRLVLIAAVFMGRDAAPARPAA